MTEQTQSVAYVYPTPRQSPPRSTTPLLHELSATMDRLARAAVRTLVAAPYREGARFSTISEIGADARVRPNELSRAAARKAMFEGLKQRIVPDRVAASAEGGIDIYFFGHGEAVGTDQQAYAMIESLNDGSRLALLQRSRSAPPQVLDAGTAAELTEALRSIKQMLRLP